MDHRDRESFRPLTISVEKLPASMARQAEINEYAAERARLLLGSYRTGEANDPETYVAVITATLARYPEEVITTVTHPTAGPIIGHIQWLPSAMEVREACEREMLPIANRLAREKRIAEQMEARRLEDEANARKPTYEELKAKYGPTFGIENPDHKKRPPPVPAPTIEQLRHHYQHYDLQFKPKKHEELEQHIERGFSPGSI